MRQCSRKIVTCLAATLAATVFSTGMGLAQDATQFKMDPRLTEMLSSFQKKASEASEAIVQNMKKSAETKNGTDQTPGLDQAQKLMESLVEFQKKGFGAPDSDSSKK